MTTVSSKRRAVRQRCTLATVLKCAALSIASFLCMVAPVSAANITVAWDQSTAEADGYLLGYGTSSGSYGQHIDTGAESRWTLSGLAPGQTYFLAVKAYTVLDSRESAYSNEISVTIPLPDLTPPVPPTNFRIQ